MSSAGRRRVRRVWPVVIVGVALPLMVAARAVRDAGWDATILVAFGEDATATRQYAEERLGEVWLRAHQGHDGKFFYVQSNDPLLLDPDENASVLDRPLYRSQRMLYPLLAGGFGLFGPETIVWAMLVVNLLALGVGTWVVSQIAIEMGGSPWWGLAFALNLGFVSEMTIGGAGIVAGVAAFASVLFTMRERYGFAIAMLSIAVLAREAMLLVAAGVAVWHWVRQENKLALLSAAVPAVVAVGWAVYLRLRIETVAVASDIEEIGWPFVGFAQAFESWLDEPVNLAAGITMMALLLLFARRALTSQSLLGWAFVGFVPLGIIFTEQVWHSYFDITRAVAPAITAFVLLAFMVPRTRAKVALSGKARGGGPDIGV